MVRARGATLSVALVAVLVAGAWAATTVVVETTATDPPASAAAAKPDASNTGPRISSLTLLSGDRSASGMGVAAGGTISGVHITGKLTLDRKNVHVVDSWIEHGVVAGTPGSGALIEYTEMGTTSGNAGGIAIGDWGYTLSHDDIHNFSDGPRANGSVTIEYSFIHDFPSLAGDHNDAIQATSLDNGLVIRGNTIWNANSQTSAIMIGADTGSIATGDILIEDNWLAGGGYTLYGGSPAKPHSETVRNNIFERKYFASSGRYGPVAYLPSNVVWQNNTYDNGQVIPASGAIGGSGSVTVAQALSVGNVALKEGNTGAKKMRFKVSLPKAAGGTVTVRFATRNGTALAGSDYAAASGTLTFRKGQRQLKVLVPVMGDKVREANETFTLQLSSAVGASIADGSGLGTITNND